MVFLSENMSLFVNRRTGKRFSHRRDIFRTTVVTRWEILGNAGFRGINVAADVIGRARGVGSKIFPDKGLNEKRSQKSFLRRKKMLNQ